MRNSLLPSRHGERGGGVCTGRSVGASFLSSSLVGIGVFAAVVLVGLQWAGGPSELAALAGPAFAAKQSAVLVGSSQPVAAARSSPFLKAQALQQVGQTPEIVYYVPVLQQPLTVTGQQVLAAAPAAEATGAAAAAAESEEAAAPAAESQEAPRVNHMKRAAREVRDDRDERRLRNDDVDFPEHYPPDHNYYSGPATNRMIPTTDIRGQMVVANPVSSIPYPSSGSSVATQNALYAGSFPKDEHDIHDDITEAAIEHPTRGMVASALEHIQSKEVGTEYFHDTLVDNDPSSYHYQQAIHVQHVAGSRNADNGMLSWNGIGGIFGPGAALGPKDIRDNVQLHAKQLPSGKLVWRGKDHLDVERIMQAGTSFTGDLTLSGDTRDLAAQVLRNANPDLSIKANRFLGYNPADPSKQVDDSNYIHTWAAYTPEGSQTRINAAKGQEMYTEWLRTHKKQGWYAMHGNPCFNGKIPCKNPSKGSSASDGGGGDGGAGGGNDKAVVAK